MALGGSLCDRESQYDSLLKLLVLQKSEFVAGAGLMPSRKSGVSPNANESFSHEFHFYASLERRENRCLTACQ
jgi:hypothetical protein